METKTIAFDLTELTEQGIFTGHASVFGNIDDTWPMPEVMDQGAFVKTLKERGGRVRICHQHDWRMPTGKPLVLREDEKGLYVEAQLVLSTQRGREDYELMKAGVLTELSIGYDVIRDEVDTVNGQKVRRLKEVRLYEISPVTIAANNQAVITNIKAAPQPEPAPEIDEPEAAIAADGPGREEHPPRAQKRAELLIDLYRYQKKYSQEA